VQIWQFIEQSTTAEIAPALKLTSVAADRRRQRNRLNQFCRLLNETARKASMKKYPVHVIDLTTRLGMQAMELLGVKSFSDASYWNELSSNQLPASYVVNWQQVGAGDALRPIKHNTAGIAVLIGPGCVDRLKDVLRWLPSGRCPVWLLSAPRSLGSRTF
jgi:hypothetical protein